MPPRFKAPCSLWRVFAHMTQSTVKGHNGPADRLQSVEGLPLTRPGPPPACRRRLRLSLISADTVLSARTPFLRRGSPSLSGRIRRAPRAQRNRGCPRRPPGSPGRGLCLFRALPAHHAEGPEPPHELRRGGRVGLRLGHAAGEHLLAPPQEPLGPLPPVHPYLEGHARVPWHELRLVPCRGVAP